MAQHKKKPSEHQVLMLAKAQHRNEFFRKFRYLLKASCGEDLYPTIPHNILENLYLNRGHLFKVIPAEGHDIPKDILNHAKRTIIKTTEKEKISFGKDGPDVSIIDFVTVGHTILRLANSITPAHFPNAQNIITAFAGICKDNDFLLCYSEKIYNLLQTYGCFYSNMGKMIYWLKHEVRVSDVGQGLDNIIIVKKQAAETISIKIDGNKRPVTRVGWPDPFEDFRWIHLKRSELNINNTDNDQPMNVYVQSHALMRLEERVDGIEEGILHFNLYASLREPKVFYDYNHNMLIEYQIFGHKVGYLRADIINEKIIIRTFLFITQSGTPEGQLLNKNTGLKMLDKKYLAIDRLSTFMTSDIGNNMAVRKIFQDAQCQYVLDLYEKIGMLCYKHSNQPTGEMMLNYLRYNDQLIPEMEEEQTEHG